MDKEWRTEKGRVFLLLWQVNPAVAPPRPSRRLAGGSWQAQVRGSSVAARSVAEIQ